MAIFLCASGPRPPCIFLIPESRAWIILTSRNGFCCGQRHSVWDSQDCRERKNTQKRVPTTSFLMHWLSKGTSVLSRSHFPFVYPHTPSPTPHELFSELKIDFHSWPSFSGPVVHLHLFGISLFLSTLAENMCFIYLFVFYLHSDSDLFLCIYLSIFFTLPVIPSALSDNLFWWCDKVQFYANEKWCHVVATNGNEDRYLTYMAAVEQEHLLAKATVQLVSDLVLKRLNATLKIKDCCSYSTAVSKRIRRINVHKVQFYFNFLKKKTIK